MSCTATMRAARLNAHLMFVALSHTWLPLTLPCDADSAVHGVTTRICDKKRLQQTLYARRRTAPHSVLRHYSGAIGLHARQPDVTSREHTTPRLIGTTCCCAM